MSSRGTKPTSVLGRYTPLKLLTKDEIGSVYLACIEGAAGFRKPVVIKVIHQHLMDDPMAIGAFAREAKLAVRLSHPNIVSVLDFGQHQGRYVRVVDYVHGPHLDQILQFLDDQGRSLRLEHVAYLMFQLLQGLAFAHSLTNDRGESLGLAHLDVSPKSILISTNGDVHLSDFGSTSQQTRAKSSDQESDTFALGTVFTKLLSLSEAPEIRESCPERYEQFQEIRARAVAKDCENRFQDAASFARAIRTLFVGTTPDEVEPSFRKMIEDTLSEPDFIKQVGTLPDLTIELDGKPIALALGPDERSAGRKASHSATSHPRKGRRGWILALSVGVALMTALIAGGILIALSRSDRSQPSAGQVTVIIEHQGNDRPPLAQEVGVGGSEDADIDVANSNQPETEGDAEPEATAEPAETDAQSPPHLRQASPNRQIPATLDGQLVSRTLVRQRSALRRCFQQGGTNVQRVTVRLEIGGDGSVSWATLEPASVQGSPLGQCLVSVARRTRFPRHAGGGLIYRVPISVETQ